MNKQIVYIIGVGRSGTSLLMTLLNGHSQITFTPETHFLRFYLGTPSVQKIIEEKGVIAFRETLEKDDYFQRLNIAEEELLEPYLMNDKSFNLKEVYRDLLHIYLGRKGKQFIGDKDPRYIDYQEVIKEMYPKAKVIHIYRDPRDVMLSKTKADWSSHRPIWMNAIISQMQIEQGRSTAKKLFGNNFYELSYESLITQPQETLTKLLSFLSLDFEEKMFDLRQSAKELVDENEMQWKDNTFKPLQASNTQKWKKQFSSTQIRTIEIICKEWFQELGYEYSNAKVGFLKTLFLKFAFSFRSIQAWFYNYKLKSQLKSIEKELLNT
ncbi:MAG: sulfotransferase [Bacteroidota bacterium]